MSRARQSSGELLVQYEELKQRFIKRTGSRLIFANNNHSYSDLVDIPKDFVAQRDWLQDLSSGTQELGLEEEKIYI